MSRPKVSASPLWHWEWEDHFEMVMFPLGQTSQWSVTPNMCVMVMLLWRTIATVNVIKSEKNKVQFAQKLNHELIKDSVL